MAHGSTPNGTLAAQFVEPLFTHGEWLALQSDLGLSTREREILEVMCEGVKDAAIAQRIGMAHDTLRSHITRLHRKLGVTNRTQLLVLVFRTHLESVRQKKRGRSAVAIETHPHRLTHVRS